MITKRTVFTIGGDITGRVFESREAAEAALNVQHENSKTDLETAANDAVAALDFFLESREFHNESQELENVWPLVDLIEALGKRLKGFAEARRLLLEAEKQKRGKRP